MRRHGDDLSAWSDEPVVRALTAPGTPEELAGEAEALAAFRSASRRSRRRFVGRFGTGASTIVAAVALSGGAAAAYTQALPSPIQSVAHGVLGPLGVPAPPHHHARPTAGAHHSPSPSPAASGGLGTTTSPTPSAATQPSAGALHPAGPGAHRSQPAAASAGRRPSSKPSSPAASPSAPVATAPVTTSTSPSPSETPRLKPAHVAMTLSARRVPAGSGDSASGQVTANSGQPLAGRRIWLAQSIPGQAGWQRIASGSTDDQGEVTVSVASLSRNVRWRLAVGRVRSPASRIIVVPQLSVTSSYDGQQDTVNVTAQAAQVGDSLELDRRVKGQWRQVQAATIGDSGGASFMVRPPRRGQAHFRVVLRATSAHGYAQARFAVAAEPGHRATR